jgi:hypothetical protein
LFQLPLDLIAHQQFSFYDESVQSEMAAKKKKKVERRGAKLMVSEAKGGDSTVLGAICSRTRNILHQFLPQASCPKEISAKTDERYKFLCSALCGLQGSLSDRQRHSTYFSSNIHIDLTSKNITDYCHTYLLTYLCTELRPS